VPALASRCEHFSGAELEQVVVGGLHRAFADGRELDTADMRYVAEEMVPLYQTYEEPIKALREWAIGRCRTAGRQDAVVDQFRKAWGGREPEPRGGTDLEERLARQPPLPPPRARLRGCTSRGGAFARPRGRSSPPRATKRSSRRRRPRRPRAGRSA